MKVLSLPIMGWARKFRDADYNTRGKAIGIASLLVLGIVLRLSLVQAQTSDYIEFVKPWVDYLATYGLHAFHYNFANYNTPYLFLLFLGHYLHLSDIAIVKGISILFDLLMAYAVYLIVGFYRPHGLTKFAAGVTVLFLPTVFINSSLWGQCDSIYTTFLLFSVYACLKNHANLSWIWWGVAIAFKLQAIFFLPFLIFMTFQRHWKLFGIGYAAGIFCLLSALPVLEGRSIMNTLSVYVNQTTVSGDSTTLSFNAATFYQWLPVGYLSTYFKRAGTLLDLGVAIGIVMLAFRSRVFRRSEILTVLCISLFAIPFFLPLMHERYFYSAEVASLILAFVTPRLAYITVIAQFVTLLSYVPYLSSDTQNPPIAYPVLSIFILLVIGVLVRETMTNRVEEYTNDTIPIPPPLQVQ